jgi:hypothetical protein
MTDDDIIKWLRDLARPSLSSAPRGITDVDAAVFDAAAHRIEHLNAQLETMSLAREDALKIVAKRNEKITALSEENERLRVALEAERSQSAMKY